MAAAVALWGSNTGVGKTLVSAGLAAAARRAALSVAYLKPVQTGFPDDSDGDTVVRYASGGRHTLGAHAAELVDAPAEPTAPDADGCDCRTLFAWRLPVGPHLAAEREGRAVEDSAILTAVREELARSASSELVLVETAGGVASPAPSGTLQCDLLAPLSLPALLVGDGGLGGISATICAHEALAARGIAVAAVALLDRRLQNEDALRRHLAPTPVVVLPPQPPHPDVGPCGGGKALGEPAVARWVDEEAAGGFEELLSLLAAAKFD